ncbi:MAG TPA: S41 family peptidase [Thermoanaerobaculia bacterium]|nr:S41 family peptidase [Thermoanaerobaculia bacterium]
MRRIIPMTLLILLTACIGMTETPQTSTKLSREQLREDFRILRQALEEGHSGIYRYTSKAEMDRIFDQAEKSLDKPMDILELYRVVAPVVGAIKCGHTALRLPDPVRQELTEKTPLLPLQVRILDQKVYVFRDLVHADRRLAGKEIRSVNGVPASRIVTTLLPMMVDDGDGAGLRQIQASGNFGIYLVTLMRLRAPYEVTVTDSGTGREETVHLAGMELTKIREASQAQAQKPAPADEPALSFLDDGGIAVMRIPEFSGLYGFFEGSFKEVQAKRTKTLILDVRDNGGGDDSLGKLLFSYFVDKPFRYYDDLILNKTSFSFEKYTTQSMLPPPSAFEKGKDGKYHWVTHPNWGINQPSQPTFRGKVLILINGRSFSTTSEFLSHMHFNQRATFLGEESGGGYYGNTSGYMPTIILPHSGISLHLPLVTYYMAVKGYKEASRGVIPDYPVSYTIAELIAGKDKEMELALKLARQP